MKAIAEGVIKNNMGLGGLQLRVRGRLANGAATFADTGQQLPVTGGPATDSGPWLWFEGREFGLGHTDALQWLRSTPLPALQP